MRKTHSPIALQPSTVSNCQPMMASLLLHIPSRFLIVTRKACTGRVKPMEALLGVGVKACYRYLCKSCNGYYLSFAYSWEMLLSSSMPERDSSLTAELYIRRGCPNVHFFSLVISFIYCLVHCSCSSFYFRSQDLSWI